MLSATRSGSPTHQPEVEGLGDAERAVISKAQDTLEGRVVRVNCEEGKSSTLQR